VGSSAEVAIRRALPMPTPACWRHEVLLPRNEVRRSRRWLGHQGPQSQARRSTGRSWSGWPTLPKIGRLRASRRPVSRAGLGEALIRGFCSWGRRRCVLVARPRKYPPERLDRGARVVTETGRPIAHVARDLGVPTETPCVRRVSALAGGVRLASLALSFHALGVASRMRDAR